MTLQIGQLTLQTAASTPRTASPDRTEHAEPVVVVAAANDSAVVADVIPATPPPEVMAEVDAAWERSAELAGQDRELHFSTDQASGRVIIEVRSLDGEVLRTIPPSRALDVIGGGDL